MNEHISVLDNMVSHAIAEEGNQTPEGIREMIRALCDALPQFQTVSEEDIEALARELEERIGITMGLGAIVEDDDKDFKPWLNDAKATIEPFYWDRYKKLLVSKKLPRDVITGTDEVTERMLSRLGDPNSNSSWDRRGMVVGHVQSGKTANYTGLICKAADAGYRLIVVIAGVHNNLRNQTQFRIDEGFIGRDMRCLWTPASRSLWKKLSSRPIWCRSDRWRLLNVWIASVVMQEICTKSRRNLRFGVLRSFPRMRVCSRICRSLCGG